MTFDCRQVAQTYLDLDFDAIPVNPLSKSPLLAGWQNIEPEWQWVNVPESSNIGIRCGGKRHLCVLDSDDKKYPTWSNVYKLLISLGLEPGSYPTIATPNGGRHVYLELTEGLAGNERIFKEEFGAGELRYGSGACVVAPPSEIPNGKYVQIDGDFRELPKIDARDLLSILENVELSGNQRIHNAHKPSRHALALLNGKGIEKYYSRSEAEQSILVSLANINYQFEDVLPLFIQYQAAGKFQDIYKKNERAGIRWLSESFNRAQLWAKTNESHSRKIAQAVIKWAIDRPWPGRTGINDKAIYIAHATIAYNSGRLEYCAGARQLADMAGISKETAIASTHRICNKGLIELVRESVAFFANIYKLKSIT